MREGGYINTQPSESRLPRGGQSLNIYAKACGFAFMDVTEDGFDVAEQ